MPMKPGPGRAVHFALSCLVLLVGVTLSGCLADPPGRTEVRFETIAKGHYSGESEDPEVRTAGTARQWARLWDDHAERLSVREEPERPKVDLTRWFIVSVIAGRQGTGEDEIEIMNITQEGGRFHLAVQETHPGGWCAVTSVETNPYHMVTVERRPDGWGQGTPPVTTETSSVTYTCDKMGRRQYVS